MINFSDIYYYNKSIVYNYWLHCYFDFKDMTKILCNMVEELVKNNSFLDYNQSIKIIKRDNSEILRNLSLSELRSYIFQK